MARLAAYQCIGQRYGCMHVQQPPWTQTLHALAEMTRGERVVVQARPEYGYGHTDCGLAPPPGAAADAALAFDLQLLNWCVHAGWGAG